MKFTAKRTELLTTLKLAARACGSSLPILNHLLIDAQKETVTATGSNLDMEVVANCPANVSQPFKIALPAKKLCSLLSAMDCEEVTLEVDIEKFQAILTGNGRFIINGLDGETFPPRMNLEQPKSFTISSGALFSLLNQTAYSASTDVSRFTIMGVHFVVSKDGLKCEASDGRRLALASKPLEDGCEGDFILPSTTVGQLLSLFDNDEMVVQFSTNIAAFSGKHCQIASKLIDDIYPNTSAVMPNPSRFNHLVTFDRLKLMALIDRATLITDEKCCSITLTLTKNRLTISAKSSANDQSDEVTEVEYKGKGLSIAFDPKFISQTLRAMTGKEVKFENEDNLSVGVFKDGDSTSIIMPMRLG